MMSGYLSQFTQPQSTGLSGLGAMLESATEANKQLSYRRETALHLQGGTVLAESGRQYTSIFDHCDVIGLQGCRIW